MGLRLYNTMGHTMQDFKPLREGFAGFYGCGPTVYNYAHIGNLRAYVCWDILDRTLHFLGYETKHVMNITDIGHLSGDSDDGEDKMVKQAEARHQSVLEIAKFYTDAFMADLDALNIRHPDVICKATEHVNDMIELIKQIEANGHTYMAGGNLYYDITTYPDYGKLANLQLDEQIAGAGRRNVVVVDENKRNPHDFVLWFTKSKFENQALTWDSPWGRGYPGWHIECSAMSMKYLGRHFDIHTGGIDHVPIHHTNEIAQSEGAFSAEERKEGPWVNYWMHNEFLLLEGGKMAKSSGRFITLQTDMPEGKGYSLKSKGFEPLDYRFFLLGGHYRKPLVFSEDGMESAKNSRAALVQRIAKVLKAANFDISKENNDDEIITFEKAKTLVSEKGAAFLEQFAQAIETDLATPKALSLLQKAVKDTHCEPKEIVTLIKIMDCVLGLRLIESASQALKNQAEATPENTHEGDEEAPVIDALVNERKEAKKAKNFARADEIRNELAAKGIEIIDTPNGTVWVRK